MPVIGDTYSIEYLSRRKVYNQPNTSNIIAATVYNYLLLLSLYIIARACYDKYYVCIIIVVYIIDRVFEFDVKNKKNI